jgi:type IV pilus assembly protein PilO
MSKFLFEELAFSGNYRRSPGKKILLALMIFSGIIVIGYLADLHRLQLNFLTQRQHNMFLQQQFSDIQKQTADLNRSRSELNQLETTFNALHQEMPTSTNNQTLIDNILQAGTASGIRINMIKPQPLLQQNFYKILPIQITVTGNYPQLSEFIKLLNQLKILMTFPEFTLIHANSNLSTAMDSAAVNSDKLILNMKINIITA